MLFRRGFEHAPPVAHAAAGTLQQLATRRRALADQPCHFLVLQIEDVVQQEHGALRGREPLQHDTKRHRDAFDSFDRAQPAGIEIDGLGQAIRAAFFFARAGAAELIEAQACDDRHQVGSS